MFFGLNPWFFLFLSKTSLPYKLVSLNYEFWFCSLVHKAPKYVLTVVSHTAWWIVEDYGYCSVIKSNFIQLFTNELNEVWFIWVFVFCFLLIVYSENSTAGCIFVRAVTSIGMLGYLRSAPWKLSMNNCNIQDYWLAILINIICSKIFIICSEMQNIVVFYVLHEDISGFLFIYLSIFYVSKRAVKIGKCWKPLHFPQTSSAECMLMFQCSTMAQRAQFSFLNCTPDSCGWQDVFLKTLVCSRMPQSDRKLWLVACFLARLDLLLSAAAIYSPACLVL